MKLSIISYYLFNVCRLCTDITFFIPDLFFFPDLFNLCLLSLFLYVLLKVNKFYLSFKKNNYGYWFFFMVYLLSVSLISSLYYFLPTLFGFNLLPFFASWDTLIIDSKSFSFSNICIYDYKFPSKLDFCHIPHILAFYIFIIIQFKVFSNLLFVLGSYWKILADFQTSWDFLLFLLLISS